MALRTDALSPRSAYAGSALFHPRSGKMYYLDNLNPLVGQGFSSRFGWVSGDSTDLILLGQGGMG